MASGNGELSVPLLNILTISSSLSYLCLPVLFSEISFQLAVMSVLNLSLDSFATVSDVSVIVVANSLLR